MSLITNAFFCQEPATNLHDVVNDRKKWPLPRQAAADLLIGSQKFSLVFMWCQIRLKGHYRFQLTCSGAVV